MQASLLLPNNYCERYMRSKIRKVFLHENRLNVTFSTTSPAKRKQVKWKQCCMSFSGGNLVDGLPPVPSNGASCFSSRLCAEHICGTECRISVFRICLNVKSSNRRKWVIKHSHATLALSLNWPAEAYALRKCETTHPTFFQTYFSKSNIHF